MTPRNFIAGLMVWLSAATIGQAATLSIAGGTLMGAKDVSVNGTLFDVSFVDGTCIALFNGCDDAADFLSDADADAASMALHQLFNAPGNTLYTWDPEKTNGCSFSNFCSIVTPVAPSSKQPFRYYFFDNWYDAEPDGYGGPSSVLLLADTDLTTNGNATYAVWAPAAQVPLPASLPLLAVGLAGIAALGRRKRRPS